jgi:methylenetetrahydrofolate dehydrogenase (NADP+)/methenyltetrahydrofolate cyclohydrolase
MIEVKILDGTEIAEYIKERQAKQVRNLRQSFGVAPKLAIVQTINNPIIDTYVRMKRKYGEDVLIDVEVYRPDVFDIASTIIALNDDQAVHGIIVQLPLAEGVDVSETLNQVRSHKDVDGLASASEFTAATAQAIDWLLNGYNVDLRKTKIAIVGNGRLVGAPLARLWKSAGLDVTIFDENSTNTAKQLRRYGVIVSATGVPGLIASDSVQPGAIVVDAATTAEHGKIVGDVSPDVRERSDITITPEKGGVGPLTVASLFENVIRAARSTVQAKRG